MTRSTGFSLSFLFAAPLVFAALMSPDPGIAETFTIRPGGKATINRHGVCQVVPNAGNAPMMVPTLNREEWSVGTGAFLQNTRTMPYVGIQACTNPRPMKENHFMTMCSDTVLQAPAYGGRMRNSYINADYFSTNSGGYYGQSADNLFWGNMEDSCVTKPVRGSDGRLYMHYMTAPNGSGGYDLTSSPP